MMPATKAAFMKPMAGAWLGSEQAAGSSDASRTGGVVAGAPARALKKEKTRDRLHPKSFARRIRQPARPRCDCVR
jgi:hypothetical protein